MAANAEQEEAVLKPGSKGKRRSGRAAKPSVKQEAPEPPSEPVKKRKKTAIKVKKEAAAGPSSETLAGSL